MAPGGFAAVGSLPLQIGAAMLAGVWYVGVLVDAIHKLLRGRKQGS